MTSIGDFQVEANPIWLRRQKMQFRLKLQKSSSLVDMDKRRSDMQGRVVKPSSSRPSRISQSSTAALTLPLERRQEVRQLEHHPHQWQSPLERDSLRSLTLSAPCLS